MKVLINIFKISLYTLIVMIPTYYLVALSVKQSLGIALILGFIISLLNEILQVLIDIKDKL